MRDVDPKQISGLPRTSSADDSRYRERRAHPRYPFVADAEILELISSARLSARTSDVGMGGCYVETLNPFSAGTRIRLCLQTEKGMFETPARVVYSHPGIGMGIAFLDTEPEQRKLLESWINELRSFFQP